MQNAEWISLFRQLPSEMHNQLVLVQENRTEISIEAVFRLEANFMVIRGRLGGTTETGLLFIVPYGQISTIFFNREVKEEEAQKLFTPAAPVRQAVPSQQGARLPASKQGTERSPLSPSAIPIPAPAVAPAVAARNNLLERLRAARNAAQPLPAGK